MDTAAIRAASKRPAQSRAEQIAALRQAVKECYCGLGPACPHWRTLTEEGRQDCSRDKRAFAESLWRNGTIG